VIDADFSRNEYGSILETAIMMGIESLDVRTDHRNQIKLVVKKKKKRV
jgi:hypothetical protein